MRRKRLLVIGNILIATGIGGLFVPFIPFLVAQVAPSVPIEQPPLTLPLATTPKSNGEITSKDGTAAQSGERLVIPRLGIDAPIVSDVDTSRHRTYSKALKKGVAHMKGTAGINSRDGNSFIFGHASRFAPSGSPYDTVFATLPKLKVGDSFQVISDGKVQSYSVAESKVVSADDVSVLAQGDKRLVTLMTCWPLGTTLKRWVVQGTLEVSSITLNR